MVQVLLALIGHLNSSVFVLLLILILAFMAVFGLGLLVAKFRHHDRKIDTLSDLSEKVIVLKTKVDLIYQHTLPPSLRPMETRSPAVLTEVGKQIVAKIKANEMLVKYLSKLIKEVEIGNPQNAYDIQMAALKVSKEKLVTFLNEEELVLVKEEAYSRGILAEDVLSVVGLLLRDHLLAQKNLPISDVDKHAK